MAANRIPLVRALLRFGGSKDVPNSVEGSVMPDTSLEQGIGYRFRTSDEDQYDDEETDDSDQFYSTATRKSKLRKLARNKQYGSSNSR